jgi:hypothetical protein
MCEKLKDSSGTANTAEKLFRVLLKTPRQRELSKRNAEISSRCRREIERGSDNMYVYEKYSKIYGLSINHIGDIYRKGVVYA